MQGDDALKIPQIPTPTKLRVFEFLDTQKYLLSSTSLATLQKKMLWFSYYFLNNNNKLSSSAPTRTCSILTQVTTRPNSPQV